MLDNSDRHIRRIATNIGIHTHTVIHKGPVKLHPPVNIRSDQLHSRRGVAWQQPEGEGVVVGDYCAVDFVAARGREIPTFQSFIIGLSDLISSEEKDIAGTDLGLGGCVVVGVVFRWGGVAQGLVDRDYNTRHFSTIEGVVSVEVKLNIERKTVSGKGYTKN